MIKMTPEELWPQILERLEHARKEHPIFARDVGEAIGVIEEELDELNRAHLGREGRDRVVDEGKDVIVTAMRLVMGEVVERRL